MNVTAEMQRPVPPRTHELLGTEPVLDRHHRRCREAAGERARGVLELRRLGRDDDEVGVGQLPGVGTGDDAAVKSDFPEMRSPSSPSFRRARTAG